MFTVFNSVSCEVKKFRPEKGGRMKAILSSCVLALFSLPALAQMTEQKPQLPVEKWTGKTVMLIGAHADDDQLSHGTLALLQAHGNKVYVLTLTTGNVGTQDPILSKTQLAEIRRREELAALTELGIPGDHYINLGYDDGLLEFEDRKAVVENLVSMDSQAAPRRAFRLGSRQELPTLAQVRSPRRRLLRRRRSACRHVALALRGTDHARRSQGVHDS
jgi:GlcNAc-PI de-N-acetylase